jgi:putative hydrolase of the HAD superfamily
MHAVILDVGGVLLVPQAETINLALGPFGVELNAEQAQRAHYAGVQSLDAAEEDLRLEGHAYLLGYTQAVGVADEYRDQALTRLRELWRGPSIDLWRQPVSGAVEGLRRLSAAGRHLGIVSNADGTIERTLHLSEICQVGPGRGVSVLAIVDSYIVGVTKPSADIFRHALEPMGVTPDQAVYVGDTLRYDVRGARAAGLHPVHFDPYELCAAREDHVHIRTLSEVDALLDQPELSG